MVKKISVEKLQLGMYVCGMDRNWMDLPFFRLKFLLVSSKQISTLKHYCKQVLIDTEKGLDEVIEVSAVIPLEKDERDKMLVCDTAFDVVELSSGEIGLIKETNPPIVHIMTDHCKQLLPQAREVELQALETQSVSIVKLLDDNDSLAELLMALHAQTKDLKV